MADPDFEMVVLERPRRPLSYYQRHGTRIWPVLPDYRAPALSPRLVDALRAARQRLRMTQGAVGRACGVHGTMISKLERGIRAPSLKLAERLVGVLELPPDVAALILAESVVPRAKGSYKRPWERAPGYRPQAGRRLGIAAALNPHSAARQPMADVPPLVAYAARSFNNW